MAAFLSMASFMPIGIPIFVNHQARLSPTSSSNSLSSSSDAARSQDIVQTKDRGTQAEGSAGFSKMSIFASQPMAAVVPPPYSSTRHQPPPYISKPRSGSTSTSNSNSKGWFRAMFGGSKTTLPRGSQSQTSLASNPASAESGPDVNLTPLPPTYNPTAPPTSTPNPNPSSASRQLGSNPSASASTLSISTVSTITSQPGVQDSLPKYEAIQTPSSKPQLTRSSTRTTNSSTPKPTGRPTWSNPYVVTDYVDPYEEYEMRQRADRERGAGESSEGDWCCGCFWVGPNHPWQAYYVF
jgi:hypothetical protein